MEQWQDENGRLWDMVALLNEGDLAGALERLDRDEQGGTPTD